MRTDTFKAPVARLSFAHELFNPAVRDGKSFYRSNFIFEKSDAGVLEEQVDKLAIEAFGDEGIEAVMSGSVRSPIIPGDGDQARDKAGNIRPGLGEDKVFIRASSMYPPAFFRITDGKRERLSEEEAFDLFVSGSYATPAVHAYTWGTKEHGGIEFGLSMLLFSHEGESLGKAADDPSKIFG